MGAQDSAALARDGLPPPGVDPKGETAVRVRGQRSEGNDRVGGAELFGSVELQGRRETGVQSVRLSVLSAQMSIPDASIA